MRQRSTLQVEGFFDPATWTISDLVLDTDSRQCALIDSVLDFDPQCGKTPVEVADASHAVVIIGAGAAGISVAASLLARNPGLDIAIIDPADIQFCLAGPVLFGVADYLPALMAYVKTYGIGLNFGRTLVSVDGPGKQAVFRQTNADGSQQLITQDFDMLHAVPPQTAPDFIRVSPLADAAGWVDVDPGTLRHKQFANVFALGDAANTANAKTAAAARKQAPVVAHNLLAARGAAKGEARYDGYGSCPLTVARGKIVLAEFSYGGKLAPRFPTWLIDGTRPSALAWYLKERILPPLYWQGMLKGRAWLAQPEVVG